MCPGVLSSQDCKDSEEAFTISQECIEYVFQENSSLRYCLTTHDFPGYKSEGVGLQGKISGGCQQKLTKVPARPQRHLDVDVGQGHRPEAVLMP